MSIDFNGYRIAFYGQSGAGKTCFLAALGLHAPGHPGSLSIDYCPLTPEDRDDEGLVKGATLIKEAREALEKGEVPDPTPAIFEEPVPTAEFLIGGEGREQTRVQLVDYSGELINPNAQSDAESLANKLREHFKQGKYDAFVWLLQAPDGGTPDDRFMTNQNQLREAFLTIQENHHQSDQDSSCAVALGLTKWDRVSDIKSNDVEAETRKLTEFVEKCRGLEDILKAGASVVEGQEELAEDLQE